MRGPNVHSSVLLNCVIVECTAARPNPYITYATRTPWRVLSSAIWSRVVRRSKLATCIHAGFLLGLFLDPKNGDIFLRNVGWLSTDYTVLYPRRQRSSLPPLWEPQFLQMQTHHSLSYTSFPFENGIRNLQQITACNRPAAVTNTGGRRTHQTNKTRQMALEVTNYFLC
jgi:hypothetical protein